MKLSVRSVRYVPTRPHTVDSNDDSSFLAAVVAFDECLDAAIIRGESYPVKPKAICYLTFDRW